MNRTLILIALGGACFAAAPAAATFDLNIIYAASVTPEQRAVFEQAEATWESLITGYQPGITLTGITITASTPNLVDPPGSDILGQAGPNGFRPFQGGFRLTQTGFMEFDSENVDDLIAQGFFDDVVVHEIGHILGIGTNWTLNNVYTNGTGQYTGQHGVAAYNAEFGQTGTFIPVELGGNSGTSNKHWDEVDLGAALTGITDTMGRDLTHEIMTGWLNIGRPPYIADFTVQSLRDIGFTVVPEPSTAAGMALAMVVLGWQVRRRQWRISAPPSKDRLPAL
ncbi:MAG: PEP-CTERM sorting domain-containing protein [Aeoliella sp.]